MIPLVITLCVALQGGGEHCVRSHEPVTFPTEQRCLDSGAMLAGIGAYRMGLKGYIYDTRLRCGDVEVFIPFERPAPRPQARGLTPNLS